MEVDPCDRGRIRRETCSPQGRWRDFSSIKEGIKCTFSLTQCGAWEKRLNPQRHGRRGWVQRLQGEWYKKNGAVNAVSSNMSDFGSQQRVWTWDSEQPWGFISRVPVTGWGTIAEHRQVRELSSGQPETPRVLQTECLWGWVPRMSTALIPLQAGCGHPAQIWALPASFIYRWQQRQRLTWTLP